MKKVKIPLEDLLAVLESMKQDGTQEIVFFEFNSLPAIADADEPDNVITFQTVSEKGEVSEEDEVIH